MQHPTHYYHKSNTIVRYIIQGIRYHTLTSLNPGKTQKINQFERRIYSQNGEDGLIQYIFHHIDTTNQYVVEIGAGDGKENNTRNLKRLGWHCIQIDGQEAPGIKSHFITAENVQPILKKYRVPKAFDLLSIDIDGNDYWVWKAITDYNPRVVVIEYNASLDPESTLTIPYDPNFNWDGTTFFGASLGALDKLGRQKGYRLIATNKTGVNAFFVKHDLAEKYFVAKPLKQIYHSPGYHQQKSGKYFGHPKSPKMHQMAEV